ncbi:hypothetical protein [Methanosphaera sp. WGK6]|uniref:hypothetical protein n=1 Tax=Methanosphaera sp. WGK6 TaxID=1561964 RepID=UPI00084C7B61|nr:hypothetical protein [Methanosphaera sp. WGK6]OED29509.1 hypothetical protein NL43_07875 [Methanosphaera sp. WGK6]
MASLKNILLVIVVLVVLVGIGCFSFLVSDDSSNVLTVNNTTNGTVGNVSLTEDVSSGSGSDVNPSGGSSQDPDTEVHVSIFTVSENETGQNEGMEPGVYRMTWTPRDGPISVEKVG